MSIGQKPWYDNEESVCEISSLKIMPMLKLSPSQCDADIGFMTIDVHRTFQKYNARKRLVKVCVPDPLCSS